MRMKWAQLLSSSFFFFLSFFLSFFFFPFFFFFAFHRFSLPIKGTCYHFIDDVRVRMCAEDGLKDSFFFFFLRLNFQVLAHDCDQDERKCDQKNGTRDNSATGTEKIFRALSQSEFREKLVRQLGGIGLRDPPPQTRKVKTTAADHSDLHVEHVPLSAGKGDCAVCWKVDHVCVSSVFSCAKCRNRKGNRVHLWIKPNKNCFQFFHSPQFDPFR